jgi:hypothetical protein
MPKLQIVVTKQSGVSYHRFVNPISYLDLGPDWSAELLWFGQDESKIDCDVLWYSKYLVTEPMFLEKIKEKGTKIIVDVDDDWELPPSHPLYRIWKDSGRDKRTVENIKLADVVTCSTLKLQDKIRQYNKNTIVIANALPFGHSVYQPLPSEPREKMTFIYAGGSSHYNDLKLLQGKFKRIGTDSWIKERAQFFMAGYLPEQVNVKAQGVVLKKQIFGEWDKMASIFAATNSYRILPSDELDTYINYFDMADVSLIPLTDHPWNSYKSNLKILESSAKHLPVICSKVEPYYPEMKNYPGIIWVEKNDWIEPIKWSIKNPGAVKDMGESLAEKVWEDYNIQKWNEVRKQLLISLIK